MLEKTSVLEAELTPSAEQVDRAEVLIEQTLELQEFPEIEEAPETAPDSETVLETTPEAEISELDDATVVETIQVAPELSTNLRPEVVPTEVVQSATSIDTTQIVSNVRPEAIANFNTGTVPTVDVDINALTQVPQAALATEGRAAKLDADLSIAPPACGIFNSGTAGDDLLIGTPCNDFLFAGDGDDIVIGLPGDDRIFGEAGNDFLIGGTGRDVIDGGAGDDLIFGDDSRSSPADGGADLIRGGDGSDVVFGGGKRDRIWRWW